MSDELANPNAVIDQFQSLWDSGKTDATTSPLAGSTEPPAAAAPATPPAETASQSEPAAAEGTDEPEYADLADYLTKAKIDPDSFYKIPAQVKIDGETKAVPLSDLFKSYQQEADYTRKTQALADQRRAWEAEQTQLKTTYQQQLGQAQQLLTLAHQQTLAEYQGVDWNKLYAEDPARYAAESLRFQQRVNQIQGYLQQSQAEQQRLQQEQQQELFTKHVPAEREKLLSARPEWRDDTQFQAARTQMRSAAQKLGFSDAELAQVYDHRQMLVLDLASRYLALQAQAPEAVKRVRTAPQVAQPGARQTRDPQTVAKQQALERFRKNPRDVDAQAAAFEAFG